MVDARLKTFLLLAILTAIVLWIGQFFGAQGLIFAIVIVVLMNGVAYFFSDKIALKMYRAQEASEKDHKQLHRMVREVAQLANIPKPKVYIINSPNPNAFATGRNPKNGSVAVTTGIMNLLTERELRGVIAHEVAHIKNRDILITTITAMIAGIISYAASMAQWAAIFGGFGGRDNNGGGLIELLVLIIIAPIIALIVCMAVSRTREFYADKVGAKIVRDPYSLASALEKLEYGSKRRPMRGPNGGESLFIVNPFAGRSFINLFSTHPPTEERVKRLRNMHA